MERRRKRVAAGSDRVRDAPSRIPFHLTGGEKGLRRNCVLFLKDRNWNSFGVARAHAMKLPRRKFLHLAAGAAALPALSRNARAQTYPARPVRIIVQPIPLGRLSKSVD